MAKIGADVHDGIHANPAILMISVLAHLEQWLAGWLIFERICVMDVMLISADLQPSVL
jgi:hypothetical protein